LFFSPQKVKTGETIVEVGNVFSIFSSSDLSNTPPSNSQTLVFFSPSFDGTGEYGHSQ
jgi:hypothetical protein